MKREWRVGVSMAEKEIARIMQLKGMKAFMREGK